MNAQKPSVDSDSRCPTHGWTHKFGTCDDVTARLSGQNTAPDDTPLGPEGGTANHAREAQVFAGYLTAGAYTLLAQLDHATSLIEQAELHRADLVSRARSAEVSWTKIGQAIGMSKQAAQQRYSPKRPTPPADPGQLTIEDA